MKSFTTAILCLSLSCGFSQQTAKKTFVISANSSTPTLYNQISTLDVNSGKKLDDLFDPKKKYSLRSNSYESYKKCEDKDREDENSVKSPVGGSVACAAYDAKSDRLFYVPLQVSELRYLDLKESEPSFTCLQNQSFNLLHSKDDVANQITRMAIGADGFGYALSNDAEHLIKFSTTGNPIIQDLGVLIDNPNNKVFVRSSCTSWGGDMVCGADGNIYLISLQNHVFKISLPSKKCDYIGTIKNLPTEFTSNGSSVDENGDLLISCGTSYGKNFSPIYKVKFPSLEAVAVENKFSGLGNVSDMASSNLLFQKSVKIEEPIKAVSGSLTTFNQLAEGTENNLPAISIFPNPISNGRFQIKTTNMKDAGVYKMILLDVTGKSIMEGKMTISNTKTNTHSFTFPAQQSKGVYFVQIADAFNRNIFSQQLIVE